MRWNYALMIIFAAGMALGIWWSFRLVDEITRRSIPLPYVPERATFRLSEAQPFLMGEGERLYLTEPGRIIEGIREAEGVPSYGVLSLARAYGGHQMVPEAQGRALATRTVHNTYRRWRDAGRPGDFLVFLGKRYAPVGARNDPTGLNRHWLANVSR